MVVPVSGTVSTPRLLKVLSVLATFGVVRSAAALLSRACARMRLAALSGSRLCDRVAARLSAADVARSARNAAKVWRPRASVTCIARHLKARPLAGASAARRFFAWRVFLATVASLMPDNHHHAKCRKPAWEPATEDCCLRDDPGSD